MTTLFISPNSPFESVGGVERYLTNLIEYSKRQVADTTILLLPTRKEDVAHRDGCVTIYTDKSLSLLKGGQPRLINQRVKEFVGRVEEIIAAHHVDIICAENFPIGLPPAYSILLNMVAVRHGIPLVLRLHSFTSSPLQTELVNQLMWDKISCVSKSVTGDCFQKGADIDRLSTDYLGVDTTTFNDSLGSGSKMRQQLHLTPQNKVVLTATRILQGGHDILDEKGVINLIQAFSRIAHRQPEARLVIAVGEAPERLREEFDNALRMLDGYIQLHEIQHVTTVRVFALDEMPDVYKAADVFVLASKNETFGQVFIEAMSSGVPVVGTKVGGIPEIIGDSRSGYLVPPNDLITLTQKIEHLLTDQTVANKFEQAGVKTISGKFTLERQLGNFFTTLRKTAGGPDPKTGPRLQP